jgi:3-oxoacyl-[acyl-carrier-protein] synthase-3
MYFPEKVLDNEYFEKIVDTSDEWIRTRTGIIERRMLENGATSDLAAKAAEDLLKSKNLSPDEIDVIIVATVTPDMFFPATACLVQNKIGAKNAWGFDLSAACSGFLYALTTGAALIESGRYRRVVVVGADKMSSIIDYTDRTTCILFGDGAGAVLLEPNIEGYGVLDSILKSDGSGAKFLNMKAGGSLRPATLETVQNREHFAYQEGQSVFKFAVVGMADVSYELMNRNNMGADDIAWLVPHQANKRIIDATARRMGLDDKKVMLNIQKYGNTTAATIPLCLWDYRKEINKGDNIVLAAFGGGFTWGATLVKWAY